MLTTTRCGASCTKSTKALTNSPFFSSFSASRARYDPESWRFARELRQRALERAVVVEVLEDQAEVSRGQAKPHSVKWKMSRFKIWHWGSQS